MREPRPVPAADSATAALLDLEGVSKSFGGVHAAQEVSFAVPCGRVTGLIGPNGAGKTTLFNMISGVLPPDRGTIRFDGRDIHGLPPHALVALGVARTFQNVELFHRMSVLDNVMVGQHVRTRCGFAGAVLKTSRVRAEEADARRRALELLRRVGLGDQAFARSGDLPFGWQRLLEIARALAARPKLLLLDEPAAGLNPSETYRLGKLIGEIRDTGVTVLMVEHDMSLTMDICEGIVVLDQGRVLAVGSPREVQSDPAVLEAYLGRGGDRKREGRPPGA